MTSPSETIAKAMEGAELAQRECIFAAQEARKANGADTYPARVLDKAAGVIDALALQVEAMKREMAEKDERIAALEAGLKPFVNAFERRREAYSKRYGDRQELGYANFDKMPDAWDMETISFTMGAFRRARALIQGDEKCTAI